MKLRGLGGFVAYITFATKAPRHQEITKKIHLKYNLNSLSYQHCAPFLSGVTTRNDGVFRAVVLGGAG